MDYQRDNALGELQVKLKWIDEKFKGKKLAFFSFRKVLVYFLAYFKVVGLPSPAVIRKHGTNLLMLWFTMKIFLMHSRGNPLGN